jgi:ATP-dependent helicase/nuclease subunit A
VVEDDEPLIHETFVRLLHAVETGALSDVLRGTVAPEVVDAAIRTMLASLRAGLRAESLELEYWTQHGLSGLVAEFIRHRDTPPPLGSAAPSFDAEVFRHAARQLLDLMTDVGGESHGVERLRRLAGAVERLRDTDDPIAILYELKPVVSALRHLRKGEDFGEDRETWTVLKTVRDGSASQPPLVERLLAPAQRWLATRLAAVFPVVTALYEHVKAERKVIDQVDLLLKLRDLLTHDKEARGYYQSLFDHLFVDEFQDTDPLQGEIVLYLCEAGAHADDWRKVIVADGKLTIVGDPKQSIYRFRRADVAMYDDALRLLGRRDRLNARLSVNFRSAPGLIDWFNACFQDLLGTPRESGQLFDRATGEVFYQRLDAYRSNAEPAHVHILPFEVEDNRIAEHYRRLEADVLGRYLRWLVEVRRFSVFDSLVGRHRPVEYGDIAILAVATTTLDALFPVLDRLGVPYAARGGRLFLEDPLHRQFLLGLRAIADARDGIALAALLRPPFFAIDPADHARAKTGAADGRSKEVADLVQELRRERFNRSPGATARDLLERTAFARTVALGPNGRQRLKGLRDLCLQLEQIAAIEGLDYDAVTAQLRGWVTDPVQLDPAPSVGTRAVQVMTVHQAKGLEFPVVVLWDGRALLTTRADSSPWLVDRNLRGWSLTLEGFAWDEPPGLDLRAIERRYTDAERKRVAYVAATRARDLLVVPKAGSPGDAHVCGRLIQSSPNESVEVLETYHERRGAPWATAIAERPAVEHSDASELEQRVAAAWGAGVADASRPRFRPASVTGEPTTPTDEAADIRVLPKRTSRYGPVFGDTVHRGIGIVLRDPSVVPPEAVRRAATQTGLTERLAEAAGDVERAVEALRREGLLNGGTSGSLRLEYPVAAPADDGRLIVGYIDVLASAGDRLDLLDFKTDDAPASRDEIAVEYIAQVRAYARMLDVPAIRGGRILRYGLLYTADGRVHWVT